MVPLMGEMLLGKHPLIVGRLEELVRGISQPGYSGPRVIVLLGESGCGKTRVIQELYERMRAVDPYWPPLAPIERVTAGGVDPMASRKLVAPPVEPRFDWAEGALPTFGWWGLNCERLNHGATQDVVLALQPQLNAHTLPLALALRDARSGMEKAKRLSRDAIAKIRDAALDEGSDAVIDLLASAGVVIPFAGTLVKWGWTGIKAAQRRHHENVLLDTYVDLGRAAAERKLTAGRELAHVLASTAHTNLPTVVAIEDIHVMGAELKALVEGLAEVERPILVVCTAWPEGTTNPTFAEWLSGAQRRGEAEVWEVPKLAPAELKAILDEFAPNTTEETADRIVKQLPNPHLLKLWLSGRFVRAQIRRHDQAVVLDGGELVLPTDIQQVLAQRWDELDEPIREALLYAAAVNPLDDDTCQFVPELVAAVAVAYDDQSEPESINQGFEGAGGPGGWCRLTGTSQQFTESLLAGHARSEAQVMNEAVSELRTISLETLMPWLLSRATGFDLPHSEDTATAVGWWLALASDATDDPSIEKVRAVALGYLAKRADVMDNQLPRAAELAGEALDAARRADLWLTDGAFALREREADCLYRAGYLAKAVDLREGLLLDQIQILGPQDRRTLSNRLNLAVSRLPGRSPVDPDELDSFECFVRELEDALDPDDSLLQDAKQTSLALQLNAGADAATIVAAAEELLARQRRMERVVPMVVQVLAAALQRAGRPDDAEAVLQQLLADQAHGDPMEQLRTRGWLVDHAEARGDLAAAVAEQRAILAARAQRYGDDHRELWVTRDRLAGLLAASGEVDEAIDQLRVIVARTDLAGGPLLYRAHLARRLEEWGRPDEALSEFQLALADVAAVEADDGVVTETSADVRADVARVLATLGRHAESVTVYRDLAGAQQSLDGGLSQAAVAAHLHAAEQMSRAKQHTEALAYYREIIDFLESDRGPDHDETLQARLSLAQALTAALEWDEALTTYENLLVDLPQEHALTLNALYGVASHLALTGKRREAVRPYRSLVAMGAARYGPDHAVTAQFQKDLEDLLAELSDASDQA